MEAQRLGATCNRLRGNQLRFEQKRLKVTVVAAFETASKGLRDEVGVDHA
jgi:hypothetical protein